jgi:hypothetical protein
MRGSRRARQTQSQGRLLALHCGMKNARAEVPAAGFGQALRASAFAMCCGRLLYDRQHHLDRNLCDIEAALEVHG